MKLLVSMGLKAGGEASEPLRPVLRLLDWDARAVIADLRHQPEPWLLAGPDEHAEMTGATPCEGLLWQATRTELLWIDPERMEIVRRFSHPLLYDVHNVCPLPDGGFALSAAGHESVLVFDAAGGLAHHHWLRSGSFAAAYEGIADFRTVPAARFKPHSHHPNFAFLLDGELWTTVFEKREAMDLEGTGRIPLPEEHPHDGVLREGLLWFTTVNGHVIGVDPHTRERRVHLDLRALLPDERMPGWCRAIEVVGDRMWVGMTMLRGTTHREVLRWLLRGARGRKLPTRVVELDWRARSVVGEMEVGNRAGGTIYAINAWG